MCNVEENKPAPVDIEAVKHEDRKDRIKIEVETYFGSTKKKKKQRGELRKRYKCTRLRPDVSLAGSVHFRGNITLQEMCCGFLLSREMWYRKSVLLGTGAG